MPTPRTVTETLTITVIDNEVFIAIVYCDLLVHSNEFQKCKEKDNPI